MIDCDISVNIAGVHFKNPVIAASGTFGYGKEYADFFDVSALGGICTKGLTLKPKYGNKGERLFETPSGLLNSIGLENPGIEYFIQNELPALVKRGPVVIANLGGETKEDYVEGARLLSASNIAIIELNISCPNVKKGGMAFGLEPDCAENLVRAVRAVCTKPLIVKLSPNAADICAVAKACEAAGTDGFSLINTIKAMAIDTEKRRPVFDNISAGLSGPAIRPIALRMVWELCRNTKLPVIGIGGIDSVDAALQFFIAGARAVQVGSATFSSCRTILNIIDGLSSYMLRHNIDKLEKLAV